MSKQNECIFLWLLKVCRLRRGNRLQERVVVLNQKGGISWRGHFVKAVSAFVWIAKSRWRDGPLPTRLCEAGQMGRAKFPVGL